MLHVFLLSAPRNVVSVSHAFSWSCPRPLMECSTRTGCYSLSLPRCMLNVNRRRAPLRVNDNADLWSGPRPSFSLAPGLPRRRRSSRPWLPALGPACASFRSSSGGSKPKRALSSKHCIPATYVNLAGGASKRPLQTLKFGLALRHCWVHLEKGIFS